MNISESFNIKRIASCNNNNNDLVIHNNNKNKKYKFLIE